MKFNNDLLYLALCSVKEISPSPERIQKTDLDNLYENCDFHKLSALVCYALEKVITPDHKWIEAKGKAIRKNMLLDLERSKIISFLEKNGIKYMPLKGVFLKEYYPKAGMRQMADNDIFFDGAYKEDVRQFMKSIGYEDFFSSKNDDEYKRPPVYNFEMHFALFSENDGKAFYSYYSNLEKMLIKDEGNDFGYHFSNEDFYIYFIAHEYKHYTHSGVGFRSLIDCGVLLDKFGKTYDWDYISDVTKTLGIAEFEKKQRVIWEKLCKDFSWDEFTEDEVTMLKFLESGGAYGTTEIGINNNISRLINAGEDKITFRNKCKYVLSRLFPDMEFYRVSYPFFYRNKYLIPVCFLYRLYKAVFHKNNVAKYEIKMLRNK